MSQNLLLGHPKVDKGLETIDVLGEVQFYGINVELGSRNLAATYVRPVRETEFKLSRATFGGAAISGQELEALLDVDSGPTNERLLTYALAGLKQAAMGKSVDAKEWLRRTLDNCKDTPEKRELLQLLSRP